MVERKAGRESTKKEAKRDRERDGEKMGGSKQGVGLEKGRERERSRDGTRQTPEALRTLFPQHAAAMIAITFPCLRSTPNSVYHYNIGRAPHGLMVCLLTRH